MIKITSNIKKENEQGWEFEVEIIDDGSSTKHKVMLAKDYYESVTEGEKIEPNTLVEKSIEFLLEREDKESILKEFDLKIINNYFPEYEDEIKVRL